MIEKKTIHIVASSNSLGNIFRQLLRWKSVVFSIKHLNSTLNEWQKKSSRPKVLHKTTTEFSVRLMNALSGYSSSIGNDCTAPSAELSEQLTVCCVYVLCLPSPPMAPTISDIDPMLYVRCSITLYFIVTQVSLTRSPTTTWGTIDHMIEKLQKVTRTQAKLSCGGRWPV